MSLRYLLPLVGALVAAGCQKPAAPHIVPKEARVVAVGPQGLELLVKVEATNPNSVTLSARSFTGKAKLDGRYDLGSVTIAKPISLPPNGPTMIDMPMTMPWTDVKSLAAIAASPSPVPYVIDGTVKIGGEHLNLDVPFSLSGTITRDQLTSAALKGLPMIRGLSAPAQH